MAEWLAGLPFVVKAASVVVIGLIATFAVFHRRSKSEGAATMDGLGHIQPDRKR